MLTDDQKYECERSHEMLAYLYDELAENERTHFELHLVDCTACTDEFAGISNSRFSVYEWQREEFADLPTPAIVIPYEQKVVTASADGWIASLRGLFAVSGWVSVAAAAAIMLAIVGIGYLMVTRQTGKVERAAAPINQELPVANELPVIENPVNIRLPDIAKPMPVSTTKLAAPKDIHPIRAAVIRRGPKVSRSLTADALPPQNEPSMSPTMKKPALSAFDDDDDKTLRLADLVDDGGV